MHGNLRKLPETEISILVVEDDEITKELIIDLLKSSILPNGSIKFVYSAENGLKGLEAYKKKKPDIIITDIRMPLMDGIEMAKEIKKINKNAKFIITTAYSDVNYLSESIDIGINQYIIKPIDMDKMFAVIEKIIDIIRLERKVSVQNEKLRFLTSELTLAEEKERHRIATILHDTVSQNLAIALIKQDNLKKYLTDNSAIECFNQVRELIELSIEFSRNLTFELSPPVLYELGIESALEWLIEKIQKNYNLKIKFNRQSDIKNMSEDLRIFLFRTIRELLINVVKHAVAQNVILNLKLSNNILIFRIEDNGVGFDISRVDIKTNYGIFSIKERLNYLGGTMEIKSTRGNGTVITLNVPLENKPENYNQQDKNS